MMITNDKHPSPGLWQVWKDVLATYATIAIVIEGIAWILGKQSFIVAFLDQIKYLVLVSLFIPVIPAYFIPRKTTQLTKSHRRILIIALFALALISGVVWLILFSNNPVLFSPIVWTIFSMIPLMFSTSAVSTLLYRQLHHHEESLNKVKDQEDNKVPIIQNKKMILIGLSILSVILIAILLTRKNKK